MRDRFAFGAAALVAAMGMSPASEWSDAFASVVPPSREPPRGRDRGLRKPVKSKALAKRHAANKRARKARRLTP